MNGPTAEQLADEAGRCLTTWKADPSWNTLLSVGQLHLKRWPSMLGVPVIERLDLSVDGGPLLEEGARALAVKAAAFVLTDDDLPAARAVAVPVDEAARALTLNADLMRAVTDRADVGLIPHTPADPAPYRPGCLTHHAYRAAWGEPPARYWLDHDTVTARQRHLLRLYTDTDLKPGSHTVTFDARP